MKQPLVTMLEKKHKKKVLIVDDDLDMRLFLKSLTEMAGYEPIMAKDGADGVQKAKSSVPDLIILDIMMPAEGGAKMYLKLQTNEKLKNIPVIVLSAIAKKTFYHYLKMLNVQAEKIISEPEAYIEKPPKAEDLLELMSEIFH